MKEKVRKKRRMEKKEKKGRKENMGEKAIHFSSWGIDRDSNTLVRKEAKIERKKTEKEELGEGEKTLDLEKGWMLLRQFPFKSHELDEDGIELNHVFGLGSL